MKSAEKSGIVTAGVAVLSVLLSAIAHAADGPLQSVLELAAPHQISFGERAGLKPVSAVVRAKTALVADGGNGELLLVDRGSGAYRRINGVIVSRDTKIAPGGSGEWYVLSPGARTVYKLSATGRMLEHLRDDHLLVAATDLVHDSADSRLFVAARYVPSVDITHRTLQVRIGRFIALIVGDWVVTRGYAVSSALGNVFIVDSSKDILIFDRAWKTGALGDARGFSGLGSLTGRNSASAAIPILRADGLGAPTTLAADGYGRVYAGDGTSLYVFQGKTPVGRIDAQALGVSTISDLRVDENLLTVTDTGAGKVIAFEILPVHGQ